MSAPLPRRPSPLAGAPLACWAEDLVGGRGPARTVMSWTVLVLMGGMAFVAGLGPALLLVLVLGTAAVLLVRGAGRSRHTAVMVAVAVLGTAALVYVWFAWGAASDAVDASPGLPAPARTGHLGAALLVALGCAVAFAVTAALSLHRRRRSAAASPVPAPAR